MNDDYCIASLYECVLLICCVHIYTHVVCDVQQVVQRACMMHQNDNVNIAFCKLKKLYHY